MPKGSYKNIKSAFKNSRLILKKTKCDAVKLENNKKNYKIVEYLVKKKIPVMGHIGYTPQFKKKFKIEGRTSSEVTKLLNEAKLIENAGAFSIVSVCLPSCKINYCDLKSTVGMVSSVRRSNISYRRYFR